ncbi:hypothetical protein JTE90_019840 [Oedothorax gibbosus]|uniref:Uncharacterized protein n=1 Tax=Oedothorax gibbosus TaxID=931172 RepID=A0AAV6V8H8_9ARAC|nr:hypothetical protein JTE90_019840 [Oedothorax gibbosus]
MTRSEVKSIRVTPPPPDLEFNKDEINEMSSREKSRGDGEERDAGWAVYTPKQLWGPNNNKTKWQKEMETPSPSSFTASLQPQLMTDRKKVIISKLDSQSKYQPNDKPQLSTTNKQKKDKHSFNHNNKNRYGRQQKPQLSSADSAIAHFQPGPPTSKAFSTAFIRGCWHGVPAPLLEVLKIEVPAPPQ